MTDIDIAALYSEHIDGGLSCNALDRLHGKWHGYTKDAFHKAGLQPRSAANAYTLASEKHNGKHHPVRLPNERLRVRLVKHDGMYLVREIDQDGKYVGGGVPASWFEIALGLELHALLKRLGAE